MSASDLTDRRYQSGSPQFLVDNMPILALEQGASKRCSPLFAGVISCPGRMPGHVCVDVPVSGFFRVCAVGHTQLPTSSTIFRHFVKGHLPD